MANIKWKPKTIIDEEKLQEELKPTQEELKKAQLELQTVAILEKLGVI